MVMNLIMIDISPILLFLLEFFTYFAQRNARFFSVPILLKILLAKFINAYSRIVSIFFINSIANRIDTRTDRFDFFINSIANRYRHAHVKS